MKRSHANLSVLLVLWFATVATTWYVKEDGTGDAPTIQAAVDSTQAGDIVLVGPGTYFEEVHPVSDITIRSEMGAEVTILDAEGARDYCLRTDGDVTNLNVEGLTLTGIDNSLSGACGLTPVSLHGDLRITQCVVEYNLCTVGAAPIMVSGAIVIDRCTVRHNAAGYQCGAIDPESGYGCLTAWGNVLVSSCLFESNGGATIAGIGMYGEVTLLDTVFRDNHGGYGDPMIEMFGSSTLRAIDSLFLNNAPFLFAYGEPRLELRHNTFVNSPWSDMDLPLLASGSVIRANVFTDSPHGPGLAFDASNGGLTVECNDSYRNDVNWMGFDPQTIGEGNLSVDPQYCAPEAGDYHLSTGSPLVPENNACGVLIGAFGVGCDALSVDEESWARIKARYR